MQSLDSLILAIALNIDSALLGISLGLVSANKSSAFAIKWALYFGGFQGVLFFLGFMCFSLLSFLHPYSHLLAGLIFLFLGIKLLVAVIKDAQESIRIPDSVFASVILSITISLDAFFSSVSGLGREAFQRALLISVVGFGMTFLCTYFAARVRVTHRRGLLIGGSFILIFLGAKSFL